MGESRLALDARQGKCWRRECQEGRLIEAVGNEVPARLGETSELMRRAAVSIRQKATVSRLNVLRFPFIAWAACKSIRRFPWFVEVFSDRIHTR